MDEIGAYQDVWLDEDFTTPGRRHGGTAADSGSEPAAGGGNGREEERYGEVLGQRSHRSRQRSMGEADEAAW